MKMTNGKYILSVGIVHTVSALLPSVFGRQFQVFSKQGFFAIDPGFLALGSGKPTDFETFAAFWCFSWGLLLFPLRLLLDEFERIQSRIPAKFLWSYAAIAAIGTYMIPAGGFTVFLLPHAIVLLVKHRGRSGAL